MKPHNATFHLFFAAVLAWTATVPAAPLKVPVAKVEMGVDKPVK